MPVISEENRTKIANAFIDATYAPLIAKHAKVADEIIERAIREHFGSVNYATFLTLPADKFHEKFSSFTVRNKAKGHYYTVNTSKPFVTPSRRCSSFDLVINSPELCTEAEAWANEQSRLKKERDVLVTETKATIMAARTDTVLREKWPEIAEYIPTKPKPIAKPVAIRTNDIMEKLANAKTPA